MGVQAAVGVQVVREQAPSDVEPAGIAIKPSCISLEGSRGRTGTLTRQFPASQFPATQVNFLRGVRVPVLPFDNRSITDFSYDARVPRVVFC